MYTTMKDIYDGKKVTIASYDYRTNSICPDKPITIYPADVVLFEGILVFYFRKIRELFHMKLFVDTDSDTRLARRVPRDINERGRDLDQVWIEIKCGKCGVSIIYLLYLLGVESIYDVRQASLRRVLQSDEEVCRCHYTARCRQHWWVDLHSISLCRFVTLQFLENTQKRW